MPELNPSEISRQTFVIAKKGFDPQQVRVYLEELASNVALLRKELEDANARVETLSAEVAVTKGAEEALQMTLVTATKTKDQMLTEAKEQAEELRHEAFQEAQRARSEAVTEADDLIVRAHEDSLRLLEEAKRNAQTVISTAQADSRDLRDSVAHLRQSLSTSRGALEGTLAAALSIVTETEDLLALPDIAEPVVVDDGPIALAGASDEFLVAAPEVFQIAEVSEIVQAPLVEAPFVDAQASHNGFIIESRESLDLDNRPIPTADELLAKLRSLGD